VVTCELQLCDKSWHKGDTSSESVQLEQNSLRQLAFMHSLVDIHSMQFTKILIAACMCVHRVGHVAWLGLQRASKACTHESALHGGYSTLHHHSNPVSAQIMSTLVIAVSPCERSKLCSTKL
jgi:hypothetical protein